jgi:Fur family transcriptional regulator, iron response regulator
MTDHLNNQADIARRIKAAGLRPTRQRVAIASILFGNGERHVCAESLHKELLDARIKVSLATIYNSLHQLTAAGLLREIGVEGTRSYFDTNTSNHFHMLDEVTNELHDVDHGSLRLSGLPQIPGDREIKRIDVIVRLQKKSG